MRGKGTKLGEGKGTKLGEGKRHKLGEGCPKVRLSQDRMPILPLHLSRNYVRSKKCPSKRCLSRKCRGTLLDSMFAPEETCQRQPLEPILPQRPNKIECFDTGILFCLV